VGRKYKHVLEIARALRFQASLPLVYLGDCVLTATHLINRLPTPVLDNKIPFEALFGKVPSYAHLRAFRCLAFAFNPQRTTNKFEPRGVPYVFLGYSDTQKGYKLLNLLAKKCFVSRDVKFVETIFPFLQHQETAYMKPIPTSNISTSV